VHSPDDDIKSMGLKVTMSRRHILDIFEKSDTRHLSAEDIYKILIKDGTDTGLATVYRVLTQFEQAGLLVRRHFGNDKAVFELNHGSHHDHVVCTQCGWVEEFIDTEIETHQTRVAQERGVKILAHSLILYAECTKQDCPHRPKD
jgi:Fur family transcriptional regulator, ferric uptake regulator